MRVERFIEIEAPVERVFDLLGDFEVVPRWMRYVREVRRTGRRTTHWIAEGPDGREIEWEVETTHFQPDRRIVWRSVDGDVDTDGEAVLEEIDRHTTMLRLVLGFYPTGSAAGIAAARLFGRDPERRLADDLERFRRLAEGGNRRRDDDRWPQRETPRPRRDAGSYARDDREWRDRRGDGRERERNFERALREARRSQIEGMRRYREERERDEERWRRTPRHAFDERQREDHPDDEPEYRPRYALTPRERERERGERRLDHDYSRRVMRRGVERLLEDPPSRYWRRED